MRVGCCVAQRPRIHSGVVVHLPDMGGPTCSSARIMYAGPPGDPMKLQELALDRKYSHVKVWGPVVGNHP